MADNPNAWMTCAASKAAYLKRYPDVRHAGQDARQHFNDFGAQEGRIWDIRSCVTSSCDAAKKAYYDANPDVKSAGYDAWKHYNEFGHKEGRKWSSDQDALMCAIIDNGLVNQKMNWRWNGWPLSDETMKVKDETNRMSVCSGTVDGKEKPGRLWDGKCYVAHAGKDVAVDPKRYLNRGYDSRLEWHTSRPHDGTPVMLDDMGVCQFKEGKEAVLGHHVGDTCFAGLAGKEIRSRAGFKVLYDMSIDAACEAAKTTYLDAYPDVNKDAWKHYTETGHREGRRWEGGMCGAPPGGPYKWSATKPSVVVSGGKDTDDLVIQPCAAYLASSEKWVPGKLRDGTCYVSDAQGGAEVGEASNVRFLENAGAFAWAQHGSDLKWGAPIKVNETGVCRAPRPGDPTRSVLGHVSDGKCVFHNNESVSDFSELVGPAGNPSITDTPRIDWSWTPKPPKDSRYVRCNDNRMAVCTGYANGVEVPGKLWSGKCYVSDGKKEVGTDVVRYLDRGNRAMRWGRSLSTGRRVKLGNKTPCQFSKFSDTNKAFEYVLGYRQGATCKGGLDGKAVQSKSADDLYAMDPKWSWVATPPSSSSRFVRDTANRMEVCSGIVNGKEKPGKLWGGKCYVADGDKEHITDVSRYLDNGDQKMEWTTWRVPNVNGAMPVTLGDMSVCQLKRGDEPVIGHRVGGTCYGGLAGRTEIDTSSEFLTLYAKF